MRELNTTADGARRVTVDIQSIGTYTLRTYYRHIGNSFVMDLLDTTGSAVLIGVPLVAGVSLISKAPRTRDSIGQLRMTADSADPDALGRSALLIQFDPGEFERLMPEPVVALAPVVAQTRLLFPTFNA